MSVERVKIDCDEDGFRLILDGEVRTPGDRWATVEDGSYRLDLRLDSSAAVELLAEAREKIGPWRAEGEAVRAEHEAFRRSTPCGCSCWGCYRGEHCEAGACEPPEAA